MPEIKNATLSSHLNFETHTRCDIFITHNKFSNINAWLNKNSYEKIFILCDANTKQKCLPLLLENIPFEKYYLIDIPSGEQYKTLETCQQVWKSLLKENATRSTLLINLGGGMVTDLGAFCASVYKRGVDFIQFPTTLLAQVDASVGGKTGINFSNIKNCLGTFSLPKAIFSDTFFLKTLPKRELRSGFAEMIKHGIILDKAYYHELKNISLEKIPISLIKRSVELKNKIVTDDPLEKGPMRKSLNFGHTIGHAIESHSLHSPKPLLHGEAIAIGMICESYLSHKNLSLPKNELDDIVSFLTSSYPLSSISKNDYSALIKLMENDKKNNQLGIAFTLIKRLGEFQSNCIISMRDIEGSFEYLLSLKHC